MIRVIGFDSYRSVNLLNKESRLHLMRKSKGERESLSLDFSINFLEKP